MIANDFDQLYFKLFSSCINVRGVQSSVIMDLQKESFFTIPNILSDVLKITDENILVKQLKERFDNKYNEGIDKYLNFLIKNDFGFCTKTPESFPSLNNKFITPYICLTSVVCYDEKEKYDLFYALNQLIDLGTQSIQIRINSRIRGKDIVNIISLFKMTRVKIVEIIFKYEDFLEDFFEDLDEINYRICLYVLSSPINKLWLNKNKMKIIYLKQEFIKYETEKIDTCLFNVNTELYLEAINYNVGLNRKISVDYNGDIKNYVDHKKVYGNIKDDLLFEIISSELFQQKWILNNDLIEKCKDCQFRYMCVSNSDIYIIKNKYHKLNSCNYDPYQNKWE